MAVGYLLCRRPSCLPLYRSYSGPAFYILTEFFNPQQLHMVAVVEGLRWCREFGHFSSYATTIVTSTLALRTALAGPLYTFTEKNQALIASAHYESSLVASSPRYAVRQKNGMVDTRLQNSLYRRTYAQKCQELGCHPLKSVIFGMFQLPFWMTATFGLRNACGLQLTPLLYWPPMIPEFVAEGLTSPTTSLGLIALTAIVTTLNVEIGHLRRVYGFATARSMPADSQGAAPKSISVVVPPRLPWQLKFAHGVCGLGAFLLTTVSFVAPSALVIFWCTSASHQLILHLLHLSPRVRAFLGIVSTPIDAKHPYQALWAVAKRHYRLLRWLSST
uniref:Glucosyltransferase MdoH n=2 Tax=Mesocestoides corti TaxID=53468 RepID=A0A5K3FRW0_MESCO